MGVCKMAMNGFFRAFVLVAALGVAACSEEAPQLTVAAEAVPERALYFILHEVEGRPDALHLSGSSFGISRYRLGAVTALIGARLVNDNRAAFLKTENRKVAETKLCLSTNNNANGCPRFVFEMVISRANGARDGVAGGTVSGNGGGDRRGLVPIQPVLQAEKEILDGVDAFHCEITAEQQRCVQFR